MIAEHSEKLKRFRAGAAPVASHPQFCYIPNALRGHVAKVVNAAVCKTAMRRFDPGRGLQKRASNIGRAFFVFHSGFGDPWYTTTQTHLSVTKP